MRATLDKGATVVVVALLSAISSCASPGTGSVNDVEAATQQWIAAFNRHSATDIVALYAKDAVFFGTSSPVLRDNPQLVWDYFKEVGSRGTATLVLGEHRVQMFGDIAINTGFYIRTATESGKLIEIPARFTFVYQRRAGKWMIVEHHSSATPRPQP